MICLRKPFSRLKRTHEGIIPFVWVLQYQCLKWITYFPLLNTFQSEYRYRYIKRKQNKRKREDGDNIDEERIDFSPIKYNIENDRYTSFNGFVLDFKEIVSNFIDRYMLFDSETTVYRNEIIDLVTFAKSVFLSAQRSLEKCNIITFLVSFFEHHSLFNLQTPINTRFLLFEDGIPNVVYINPRFFLSTELYIYIYPFFRLKRI